MKSLFVLILFWLNEFFSPQMNRFSFEIWLIIIIRCHSISKKRFFIFTSTETENKTVLSEIVKIVINICQISILKYFCNFWEKIDLRKKSVKVNFLLSTLGCNNFKLFFVKLKDFSIIFSIYLNSVWHQNIFGYLLRHCILSLLNFPFR